MSRLLLLAVLALASPALKAQTACPSHIACLSWQASPGWNDGTPFAAGTIVTYRVYNGPRASIGANPIASTRELSINISNLPSGEQCFAVTAEADGKQSVLSGIVCIFIRPAAPTDGAIEAPTDGSIEER